MNLILLFVTLCSLGVANGWTGEALSVWMLQGKPQAAPQGNTGGVVRV